MITTRRTAEELYVYCNGRLIYKRWLPTAFRPVSYGKVMHSY